MKMAMIVAMDEEGCIGKQGDLPWRLKSDMIRFKNLTESDGYNAVIMGRKTWDSLPDSFQPLPERVNIVMSRDIGWSHDEAEVALYHGRAIEIAYAEACDECWVIGGAQIYEMFIDLVQGMSNSQSGIVAGGLNPLWKNWKPMQTMNMQQPIRFGQRHDRKKTAGLRSGCQCLIP